MKPIWTTVALMAITGVCCLPATSARAIRERNYQQLQKPLEVTFTELKPQIASIWIPSITTSTKTLQIPVSGLPGTPLPLEEMSRLVYTVTYKRQPTYILQGTVSITPTASFSSTDQQLIQQPLITLRQSSQAASIPDSRVRCSSLMVSHSSSISCSFSTMIFSFNQPPPSGTAQALISIPGTGLLVQTPQLAYDFSTPAAAASNLRLSSTDQTLFRSLQSQQPAPSTALVTNYFETGRDTILPNAVAGSQPPPQSVVTDTKTYTYTALFGDVPKDKCGQKWKALATASIESTSDGLQPPETVTSEVDLELLGCEYLTAREPTMHGCNEAAPAAAAAARSNGAAKHQPSSDQRQRLRTTSDQITKLGMSQKQNSAATARSSSAAAAAAAAARSGGAPRPASNNRPPFKRAGKDAASGAAAAAPGSRGEQTRINNLERLDKSDLEPPVVRPKKGRFASRPSETTAPGKRNTKKGRTPAAAAAPAVASAAAQIEAAVDFRVSLTVQRPEVASLHQAAASAAAAADVGSDPRPAPAQTTAVNGRGSSRGSVMEKAVAAAATAAAAMSVEVSSEKLDEPVGIPTSLPAAAAAAAPMLSGRATADSTDSDDVSNDSDDKQQADAQQERLLLKEPTVQVIERESSPARVAAATATDSSSTSSSSQKSQTGTAVKKQFVKEDGVVSTAALPANVFMAAAGSSLCGRNVCSPGQICMDDSVCCNPGSSTCGGSCCPYGNICMSGRCMPPGSSTCGASACSPFQTCLSGKCCDASAPVCGNTCCDANQMCVNGQCAASGSSACGGTVCGPNQQCVAPGVCCNAGESPCGASCCGAGNTCLNGQCVAGGSSLCAGQICGPGSVCAGGALCCPIGASFCGGQCCGSGNQCVDGRCMAFGSTSCGTNICNADQTCQSGVCCNRGESGCGTGCCATGAGMRCINNQCLAAGTQPCGSTSCPPGTTCGDPYRSLCCAQGTMACAGSCCPADHVCSWRQQCVPWNSPDAAGGGHRHDVDFIAGLQNPGYGYGYNPMGYGRRHRATK